MMEQRSLDVHATAMSIPTDAWPKTITNIMGLSAALTQTGPENTAMLFEGSMLRWLTLRGKVEVWHCGDHWHVNNQEHSGSLFDALARACIEEVRQ